VPVRGDPEPQSALILTPRSAAAAAWHRSGPTLRSWLGPCDALLDLAAVSSFFSVPVAILRRHAL